MAQVIDIASTPSDEKRKRVEPANATHKAIEQLCLDQQKRRQQQQREQQRDCIAWLREYHRWTEAGCSAQRNRGDIEWGLEDDDSSHLGPAPPGLENDDTKRR